MDAVLNSAADVDARRAKSSRRNAMNEILRDAYVDDNQRGVDRWNKIIREEGIDFELALPLSLIFGKTVGYIFTFIPLYILARIIFKHLRPYLPYFRGVQKALDQYGSKNAS